VFSCAVPIVNGESSSLVWCAWPFSIAAVFVAVFLAARFFLHGAPSEVRGNLCTAP